ncbi:hypothetical protein [Mycetocola miduiensis]|uniref:Phosphodiesterase n=1 Tax=Mycetocola miduiensis TaxID=995034 RepID=A0A1I5AAW1_9MICO|nr:hypothetical protein [Mycetocola miduiensis]SFN59597.1 hypothetical protein SAMN05216219_1308 [Mycetocola miduiensis]
MSGASTVGRLLAEVFSLLKRLRHPRPIHPHGVALQGTVRFLTGSAPTGVAFLDSPPAAEIAVSARVSRSIGVPSPLPDVIGLALRLATPAGAADILLASTGFGVPSRFWLALQRSPSRAKFTTLFPYRSPRGPVLLAARTIDPENLPTEPRDLAAALEHTTWRLRLYAATPTGLWHPFAVLELGRPAGSPLDRSDRYDPVSNALPGTESYPWARRVREPSYSTVQGRPS